jgi:hypothetical protein
MKSLGDAARGRLPVGPEACFLIGAVGLCTAALSVLAAPGYWVKPQIIAPALTADLALGMPTLGYLFLVRTRRLSALALVPLFAIGLALARWWIPEAHRDAGGSIRLVLALSDAALTAWLLLRIGALGAAYRSHRAGHQGNEAMGRALAGVFPSRLGGLIHTELSVVWYATTAWGRDARIRSGTRAFTYHRRGAYPALLAVVFMAIGVETGAMHLLLGLWSRAVAWISTGLGAYSALWLVGDYHASRLNPIVVGGDSLELVTGLRWRSSIPWRNVRGATDRRPSDPSVRMTLLGKPDFWLELEEPIVVRGILGVERRVRFVGLGADDGVALRETIEARRALTAGTSCGPRGDETA